MLIWLISYSFCSLCVCIHIYTYIHTFTYKVYIFLKLPAVFFLGFWEGIEINRIQSCWSHFLTKPRDLHVRWKALLLLSHSWLTLFKWLDMVLTELTSLWPPTFYRPQSTGWGWSSFATPRNLTFDFAVRNTVYILSFFETELLLWTQYIILSSF